MKKEKPEMGERIKQVREEIAGRTQTEFAEELGVTQSMVSAWETGRDEPSVEAYLKLAGKATKAEDRLWFLEQAGVNTSQTLFDAVGKLPSAPSVVQALLSKLPSKVQAFRVDAETARGGVFAEGDIVLLEPARDPKDYRPVLNQIAFLDFAAPADRPRHPAQDNWPTGLFVGRLRCKRYMHSRLSYALTVGPFGDSEKEWKGSEIRIGGYQHPGSEIAKDQEEAKIQAPERIKLFPGVRIMGRAIAWFSAPKEAK